jgi:hypothetical protein
MGATAKDILLQHERAFQLLPGIETHQSNTFLQKATSLKNLISKIENVNEAYGKDIQNISNAYKVPKEHISKIVVETLESLHIFTNKDLMAQLIKGVKWVNKGVGSRPWALLTEALTKEDTQKSSEWVASLAWNDLANKPYCVSDMTLDENKNMTKYIYEKGVRDFVIFDDGAYSGAQKASSIFVDTWKELLAFDPNASFNIFVVIPFYTKVALDKFRNSANFHSKFNLDIVMENKEARCTIYRDTSMNRYVYIWKGGVEMPSTLEIINQKTQETLIPLNQNAVKMSQDLSRTIFETIFKGGASLTIFEHKVPDALSLPSPIGQVFMRHLSDQFKATPPYKHKASSPDTQKTFPCVAVAGGSKYTSYKGHRHVIYTSKRGNKYILKNKKKIYLH